MDTVIFLGALTLMVVVGVWFFRTASKKNNNRKRRQAESKQSRLARNRHQHTGHAVLHNHSTRRMHAGQDDIWRSSRVKAYETKWQSGVFVANKILSDSELAAEEHEPEHDLRMPSVEYSPSEDTFSDKRKAAGHKSSRK